MKNDLMLHNLGGGVESADYTTHLLRVGNIDDNWKGFADRFHNGVDQRAGELEPRTVIIDYDVEVSYLGTHIFKNLSQLLLANGSPREASLYVVRLDTKVGFIQRFTSTSTPAVNGNWFVSDEDVGKTIELYISETPPSFDWTNIQV